MKNFLKGDKGYTLVEMFFLVWLVIGVAAVVGEVKCAIKAINCDWQAPYRAEVIYTGAFCTGLGCFVGYMDIPDGIQTNEK
jgi:hypothetical protein